MNYYWALGLKVRRAIPAGAPNAFWVADTAASMPHLSTNRGSDANDITASTPSRQLYLEKEKFRTFLIRKETKGK